MLKQLFMKVRGGENIQSRDYMYIQSVQLGHGKLGIHSKNCNEVALNVQIACL